MAVADEHFAGLTVAVVVLNFAGVILAVLHFAGVILAVLHFAGVTVAVEVVG